MKAFLIGILGAVVGSVLTFFAQRYFTSDPPIADLYCEPAELEVDAQLICHDLSKFAAGTRWNMGDGRLYEDGKKEVRHKYAKDRTYTIAITAFDRDKRQHSTRTTQVRVLPITAVGPLTISLAGEATRQSIVQTQAFPVSEVKNDHPNPFASSTKTFTKKFSVEDGTTIRDVRFVTRSANNASSVQTARAGGTDVLLTFDLASGPAVDRWRGWLDGQVLVDVERPQPGETITLAKNLSVTRAGYFRIGPRVDLSGFALIKVLGAKGQVLAQGAPDQPLVLPSADVALRLKVDQASTYLSVEKLASGMR